MDAYVGRPGHGKSYSVVEFVVIPSLKQDRHVITNIPLAVDELIAVYGGSITQMPLDWADNADWALSIPNGAVLVLDEVWRRFPSGQKVTAANPDDLALFKEHRHRVDSDGKSMRIVLVTQDTSDLSSWVRKLVDHTFFMNKLSDVGAKNRFRVDIYNGCPTGERLPKRSLIRSTYGEYKPEIYRYYSSATQSETGIVGDESAADGRTNIWRSTFIWVTLGGGVLAAIAGAYFVVDFFTPDIAPTESAAAAVQQVQRVPSVAPASLVNPPPPQAQRVATGGTQTAQRTASDGVPFSSTWRVSGYIGRSEQVGAGSGTAAGPLSPDPLPDYPDRSLGAVNPLNERPPLVILSGLFGSMRYVLMSECESYPDGIHWRCDVDGERVTPWTGQPSFRATMDTGTQTAADGAQSAAANRVTGG